MNSPFVWVLILTNLVLALSANVLSTQWAASGMKISPFLLVLTIISPAVFITFGMVTSRTGLAVGSAVIDSLLTVGSVLLGLFAFGEWRDLSTQKCAGLLLAIL